MLSQVLMRLLEIYSMMQLSSEADYISRTVQVDLDRILWTVLEKYHSFPGFTLLLGSLLHFIINTKQRDTYPPGMVADLYLVRRRGEGHILDDLGFFGLITVHWHVFIAGTPVFLTYFTELLENPERSGI